jgi:alpha-1,6-mannosyltransferase
VKLCTVTQSYAETGGGVRTMIHAQRELFRGLHGSTHVLIVPGADNATVQDGNLTTHTIASPRVPGSNVYRLLLRSDRVLRLLRQEMPDVIEVHCAYNLPWTALLHRRRHGGVVSGVYMTDLPVAYVEAPLTGRVGRRLAGAARRMAETYVGSLYRRCDVVVAISPVIRDRLHGLGVPASYVPLGVDLDTFHPSRRSAALRAELGAGDEDLLLVYAGRLDSEKRPDIVLDAFAALPGHVTARLVLAGDGPLRPRLAARAAEVGNVHVTDFIRDRRELARLLASADVYISAMPHETFGLSVVEAQACGLPVVGVRSGAMVDRVVDGDDGILVDPGPRAAQVAALSAAVASTPRDAWRTMGGRGRARVEREFSWERTFRSLFALYAEAGAAVPALPERDGAVVTP